MPALFQGLSRRLVLTGVAQPPDTLLDGADFEAFCEEFVRHPKGPLKGKPFVWESWERDFWAEALKTHYDYEEERWARVYTNVLWGMPRKNSKTTNASSFALFAGGFLFDDAPEVPLAAGSAKQADIAFSMAKSIIGDSSELQDIFIPQQYSIKVPHNGGVIQRLAADGSLFHGASVSAAVKDELHAWTQPRQIELNAAIDTATGAREDPFILGITTAGHNKDTILGQLYDSALRLDDVHREPGLIVAKDEASGFLMVWYGLEDDADWEDEANWRLANPASWIRTKYLRQQKAKPGMHPLDFRRLHLNQWTVAKEAWLPVGAWQRCKSADEKPEKPVIVAAVDASRYHDCTALSWVWRREEDRQPVIRTRVWATAASAANGAKCDVVLETEAIDLRVVKQYIVDVLAEECEVAGIVFDPQFFGTIADELDDLGFQMIELNQNSSRMREAESQFYQDVVTAAIHHNGDEVLTSHVEATGAKPTHNGWKVTKLTATRKIDACVATIMANWGLKQVPDKPLKGFLISWDSLKKKEEPEAEAA